LEALDHVVGILTADAAIHDLDGFPLGHHAHQVHL
jgi:hypothetical protein